MRQFDACRGQWEAVVDLVQSARSEPVTPPGYWCSLSWALDDLAQQLTTVAIIDGKIDTTVRAKCIDLIDASIDDAQQEQAAKAVSRLLEARRKLIALPLELLQMHARADEHR